MSQSIYSKSNFNELKFHSMGHYEFVCFTRKNPHKDSINEDALGFFSLKGDGLVLVVADGAGGYPKGEEASEELITSIFSQLEQSSSERKENNTRHQILDGIEVANDSLLQASIGAKTTAVVCEISGRKLRSYNIGDSGLIVCGQKGKLKTKTLSHSPVGYGVEAGLITEDEALSHPDLNIVANLVGTQEMTIELGPQVLLDDKDTILIASDGLFDNFQIEKLCHMIRKGSLIEVGENIIHFFDQGIIADPEGEEIKFDDLSFILCRLRG